MFLFVLVGESGLGKSTLINSLFLTDLYSPEFPGPSYRIKKTVQVEQSKVLIKEGGVQLLLTIVDTPGFGDAVDNSNCWQPVIDYIDSKFEDYLNAESRVNRRQMPDNRVQCCLYFIAPSGHGSHHRHHCMQVLPLSQTSLQHTVDGEPDLDTEALTSALVELLHSVSLRLLTLKVAFLMAVTSARRISELGALSVQNDLCIFRPSTVTLRLDSSFIPKIMKEIQEHKIKIYEFPETDDEEENKLFKKLKLLGLLHLLLLASWEFFDFMATLLSAALLGCSYLAKGNLAQIYELQSTLPIIDFRLCPSVLHKLHGDPETVQKREREIAPSSFAL
ncbi:PREDICTED: septin-7-like [Thamnophis sirtalis]|uniref:Septin-7-like n=1 Tax=Thamnophis sirtalis TaxID=35019 RepID=A0A6I9YIK6_9SAUR|nr:PREDICTED: septin-7-like [Thamnophis sirtalis]